MILVLNQTRLLISDDLLHLQLQSIINANSRKKRESFARSVVKSVAKSVGISVGEANGDTHKAYQIMCKKNEPYGKIRKLSTTKALRQNLMNFHMTSLYVP